MSKRQLIRDAADKRCITRKKSGYPKNGTVLSGSLSFASRGLRWQPSKADESGIGYRKAAT